MSVDPTEHMHDQEKSQNAYNFCADYPGQKVSNEKEDSCKYPSHRVVFYYSYYYYFFYYCFYYCFCLLLLLLLLPPLLIPRVSLAHKRIGAPIKQSHFRARESIVAKEKLESSSCPDILLYYALRWRLNLTRYERRTMRMMYSTWSRGIKGWLILRSLILVRNFYGWKECKKK